MEEGSYGRQVFRATWRSSTVWVVAVVGLMALAFAAGALLSPRGSWLLGGLALVFGLLSFFLL